MQRFYLIRYYITCRIKNECKFSQATFSYLLYCVCCGHENFSRINTNVDCFFLCLISITLFLLRRCYTTLHYNRDNIIFPLFIDKKKTKWSKQKRTCGLVFAYKFSVTIYKIRRRDHDEIICIVMVLSVRFSSFILACCRPHPRRRCRSFRL